MTNPLTTTATTSMCDCRHNVLITALFWHSKQSDITYMSHIDNKNNSWIKKKVISIFFTHEINPKEKYFTPVRQYILMIEITYNSRTSSAELKIHR